jgi:hypothetical protein
MTLRLDHAPLSAGESCVCLLNFIRPHVALPEGELIAPPDARELEWEDIAARIEESTVLIQPYQNPASIRLDTATLTGGVTRRSFWEDRWCMACNGSNLQSCKNGDCKNGVIVRKVPQVLGFDPASGLPIVADVFVRSPCPSCAATRRVICPHCKDGIDLRLQTEGR